MKILDNIEDIDIYMPSKTYNGLITFLLNYKEWPICLYKDKIKPLESLSSLKEIDYFFAEIVNIKFIKRGLFTDSQVEWGINKFGKNKVILYSYNVIDFSHFKYKNDLPLISTSKISFASHRADKVFFYGEVPILNYSPPKQQNSLILVQNSYEVQKNSIPIFKKIINPIIMDIKLTFFHLNF